MLDVSCKVTHNRGENEHVFVTISPFNISSLLDTLPIKSELIIQLKASKLSGFPIQCTTAVAFITTSV